MWTYMIKFQADWLQKNQSSYKQADQYFDGLVRDCIISNVSALKIL